MVSSLQNKPGQSAVLTAEAPVLRDQVMVGLNRNHDSCAGIVMVDGNMTGCDECSLQLCLILSDAMPPSIMCLFLFIYNTSGSFSTSKSGT